MIGSDLKCRPRPAAEVFAGCEDMPFARLDAGEGPDMLCLGGRMDLPRSAALLIEALPPVSMIAGDSPAAARIGWLLDRLEVEQREGGPGATAMAAQIMQMVFIELIRSIPEDDNLGWLAALSDPHIGPAIRAIHHEPGRNWRLEDLAEISHLSRSQFAARFRAAVGRSPIDYLLNWRMTLARKALAQPGASVSAVAAELGYASESAFGLAFRRITGTTPHRASKSSFRLPPAGAVLGVNDQRAGSNRPPGRRSGCFRRRPKLAIRSVPHGRQSRGRERTGSFWASDTKLLTVNLLVSKSRSDSSSRWDSSRTAMSLAEHQDLPSSCHS